MTGLLIQMYHAAHCVSNQLRDEKSVPAYRSATVDVLFIIVVEGEETRSFHFFKFTQIAWVNYVIILQTRSRVPSASSS